MNSHSVIAQHYSIRDRYNTVNDCLRLVKDSQLGNIDKIKIETMLIRIKVKLLGHSGRRESPIVDDDAFTALRHQVEATCNATGDDRLLARLIESISALATALEEEGRSFSCGRSVRHCSWSTIGCHESCSNRSSSSMAGEKLGLD